MNMPCAGRASRPGVGGAGLALRGNLGTDMWALKGGSGCLAAVAPYGHPWGKPLHWKAVRGPLMGRLTEQRGGELWAHPPVGVAQQYATI